MMIRQAVRWTLEFLYWLLAVVNLGAGALGLWRPFGILGVARPSTFSLLTQHYGDGDDDNDAVLLSNEVLIHLHLSRMCFALSVTVGLLLVCVSNESLRIRHIVLRLVCTGTAVYSAGEVWIDTPVALRLGLNTHDLEALSLLAPCACWPLL